MNSIRIAMSAALAAFALACSPPASEQPTDPAASAPGATTAASDPAELVRGLYVRYQADTSEAFPPLEAQAPWSAEMRTALIAMMARSEARNEPILDFDPIVGAQDWELQNVNVTTDSIAENSHAVVRASVTNAGFTEDIVYDLVWRDGGWRVDNIRGRDWDLRQIATQP